MLFPLDYQGAYTDSCDNRYTKPLDALTQGIKPVRAPPTSTGAFSPAPRACWGLSRVFLSETADTVETDYETTVPQNDLRNGRFRSCLRESLLVVVK
jgi:hypothetical protein